MDKVQAQAARAGAQVFARDGFLKVDRLFSNAEMATF
jgi:hypothetical protein